MHSHTHHSRDCLLSYDGIIASCRRRGVDVLAVTDHNEIEGAFALKERAPFPVIVGEEVFTNAGEIIGLFLTSFIPKGLSPHETIKRIHAQGGLAYVPHPFDSYRRGAIGGATLDLILPEIDMLEVLNARNVNRDDDATALRYAERHGIVKGAGSDAHSLGEFGTAYLEMEPFEGPQDFLEKARRGKVGGGHSAHRVHLYSSYAKVSKTLRHAIGRA